MPEKAESKKLSVRASITSMSAHDAGTRVDTVAEVVLDDVSIVRVDGAFLLRDTNIADAVGGGSEPSTPVVNERPRKTVARVRVTTPPSMDAFAAVSGDHNPIHRSVAVARLAGLGAPIVHGAWTSAAAQQAVVEHAASGRADRVTSWRARFMAPVELSENLTVTVVRTGVRDAHTVVEATVVANREDGAVPVLLATAEIAPPRTAYLFPGQGIQRPGMGMDGYDRSPAAREIWDRADKHTRERLGFSILTIVRDNPTIISAAGADGSIEVHRHPLGVLHLTQFTQVAMAALASAQVAELREEGLFDEDSICAGHSVGEYNALAAVGGVLQLEAVVELVFRRGQAMHHLVPRDEAGRSDYRLGVVRPHQIGMDHAQVEELVGELRDELGQTLEIVNYNLRGKQYAVAGTNAALAALESALKSRATKDSRPAFLYVPGIDVPFHSSVLRNGVEEFRSHLAMGLPSRIDPDLLVDRYVPNLVPRLFSLDRAYVEEVCALVDSESLTEVLRDWEDWKDEPERLCRELLIELLAWQFASPVRWIETQDLLFTPVEEGGVGIERVVEVGLGSAPTVANLAKGTLALDAGTSDVVVHNIEADRAVVFAIDENPELEDLDGAGPVAGSDTDESNAGGSQAEG
ncbi:MAG: acyltransferase domain-containing protein, partial [Microthrixaceae bacterium]